MTESKENIYEEAPKPKSELKNINIFEMNDLRCDQNFEERWFNSVDS